jgi:hypothetical protein
MFCIDTFSAIIVGIIALVLLILSRDKKEE